MTSRRKNNSVCDRVKAKPSKPKPESKMGIALGTIGKFPINGLRHPETDTTNGWYIWCGTELSQAEDFFSSLHIEHIKDYLPEVIEYLDLPAGYRFLIDSNNYEDVWFDNELLKV